MRQQSLADGFAGVRSSLADNISLAPGTIFSVTDKYNHCLRLSFGMRWTDRMERAVMRVGELIRSLRKIPPEFSRGRSLRRMSAKALSVKKGRQINKLLC